MTRTGLMFPYSGTFVKWREMLLTARKPCKLLVSISGAWDQPRGVVNFFLVMTAANVIRALFGTMLVIHGLVGKGTGYNDVEAPLREEERLTPHRPFTKQGRAAFVGFGALLIVLAVMGKFNN